jgi:hypothetical protein
MTITAKNVTHTPGPWNVEVKRNKLRIRARVQSVTEYDHRFLIAELPVHRFGSYDLVPEMKASPTSVSWSQDHDQEHNARLIAAAPDLLAALVALRDGFLDGSIKFTKKRQADSDPHHPANTAMWAAIEKAEGDD